MKLFVNCFNLLSIVQFTCLFLCHTICDADQSDDQASGSGELPIEPSTIATIDPSSTEPTSTTQKLLVPFLTNIDALPPSASVYFVPLPPSSSLSVDQLPTSVFGVQTRTTVSLSTSTAFSLQPSPSPLSLVSYIIHLSRTIVINQLQVTTVLQSIAESLADQLALEESDIHNINIISSERRKRQASEEQLVSFSAVEFAVSEEHVSSVELLMTKLRNGNLVQVQVFPNETVQVKEIERSPSDSPREPGSSLSAGQLTGIVGGLTGLVLVILVVASVVFLVVKARRSNESQEIVNLRHTYGYQYTSHSTSQWPPRSPLL